MNMQPHCGVCIGNCRLLEVNTMTYPNVHVECSGLWDKDASLGMVEPTVRSMAKPSLNP